MADHLRGALEMYVREMKLAARQRVAGRAGQAPTDFTRGMDAGEASVLAGLERLLDDAPRTGPALPRARGRAARNVRMRVGHSAGLISPTVHGVTETGGRTLCGSGLGYDGPDQFTADPITCDRCLAGGTT